ncbi:MAG: S1C family serine protease [Synergistaceae bacterium]|jgi:hypothetical protein|nr:S1C family serine protease [Synergistaceae bacterium]
MRRALYVAMTFVFLGMLLPRQSDALSVADLFKRHSPPIATLIVTRKDGKESQGTGFLISSGGELLTNFHVIDNAESVEVHFSKTLWYSAKRIVAQDPEKDLALLWIERVDPSLSYLQINPAKIPEGSDLVVIGTPRGFDKTVSTGIVSGYRTRGKTSLIQITAPISSGSSGSPIFEMGGRVIGIAIGGLQDSQGLNFAVDSREIASFLRTRPFNMPAAAGGKTTPSANAALDVQKPPRLLSLPEILAKLEMARPRMAIAEARRKLGAPDEENEQGQNYTLNLWDFKSNNALLFVWDRDKIVEHAEWVERYATKEEAASRAQTMMALAAQSFGKHSAASQNSKTWKRDGYSIGIDRQSEEDIHLVMFKATR